MKEYPIIFSTELIPKILDGLKTQTRRVVAEYNSEVGEGKVDWSKFCWDGSELFTLPILDGYRRKRKAEKAPSPFTDGKPKTGQYLHVPYNWTEDETIYRIYPKYEVGDLLWVRETWRPYSEKEVRIEYKADGNIIDYPEQPEFSFYACGQAWRPSIFMPRWASRILLEITEVRAERLQEISGLDCIREGLLGEEYQTAPQVIDDFRRLWDFLNAKRGYGWDKNPWVWVIGFKVLRQLC